MKDEIKKPDMVSWPVMQKLRMERTWYSPLTTISRLFLPNGDYECFILEDTILDRDTNQDGKLQESEKIYGKTAIPSGIYEVVLGHSETYRKEMPFLKDVPLYSGIMIHPGNFHTDTNGCLLTGTGIDRDRVTESVLAFDRLFPKIKDMLVQERLWIEIVGGYTA